MKGISHIKRLAAGLACFLTVYTVLSLIPNPPAFATSSSSSAATPASPSVATPSSSSPATASPSVPFAPEEIIYLIMPELIAMETSQTDESSWRQQLPREIEGRTASGEVIWCSLRWDVSHVHPDKPGLYLADAEALLPDGCIWGTYTETNFKPIISIHSPGDSLVMDVYTSMGYWGLRGHTWTFAMKAGQDMTPLVEKLESMTDYIGILDTTHDSIRFTADWDFSGVTPEKPGLYYIHRNLSLDEDSLPEGIAPEDIYLPDYWKELPVLFSVEEPGGPQLYGVLENPYEFFGSYAKLSDEELESLEVWYSIDDGSWRLQTDEELMKMDLSNYWIYKDKMESGRLYSFRLKMGDHISQELTVQKTEESPIWFSWTLGGNRDGTIDVEFPAVSQPPPQVPDINGTLSPEPSETPPTESTQRPADDEGVLPPSGGISTDNEDFTPDSPYQPVAEPESSTMLSNSDTAENNPELPSGTAPSYENETAGQREDRTPSQESSWSWNEKNTASESEKPPENTSESSVPAIAASTGAAPVPEEIVTRWVSQINGSRVQKLLEIYPEWVLFQKEDVSVLISSDWLKKQQLKDNDTLTVKVSPGTDRTVTILINQKTPEEPPVYRVETHQQTIRQPAAVNPAILFLFLTGCAFVFLFLKRRWKK